jgi:hypothetical protein
MPDQPEPLQERKSMKQYWWLIVLVSLMSGCQSMLITPNDMDWPSDQVAAEDQVQSYRAINGAKADVFFPGTDLDDLDVRIKNPAEVTLLGVTDKNFPNVSIPSDRVGVQVNVLDGSGRETGEMPRCYTVIVTCPKNMKAMVKRGSVSVDQLGLSVWEPTHERNWVEVDLAQRRKDLGFLTHLIRSFRKPIR